MRHFLTLLIFATLVTTLHSQKSDLPSTHFVYKNSAQVELFGHGLFYSLNYERVIFNGQKFKTLGQIGFAYYPPETGIIDTWIPVAINELFSFGKHHIELGAGHVFNNEAVNKHEDTVREHWTGFFIARLGYRYQQPDGRLLVRVGFTPFLEYEDTNDFHPSGGLAIGYGF